MTGRFLTDLDVQQLDDAHVRLLAPLVYDSPVLRATVTVPAGFVSDFASVPRWLTLTYALVGGRAKRAGVVHDWLYTVGGLTPAPTDRVTQRQADDAFAEAIRASGQPQPGSRRLAWPMWLGLRLGGWVAWRAHRRAQARPGWSPLTG